MCVGGAPSAPTPPPPPKPAPPPKVLPPATPANSDIRRVTARARSAGLASSRQRAGTVKTSPQGLSTEANTAKKTLLGQ